ncbi:MAG: hypothetical protein JOZ69_17810 [Myxococcales bacterium]|nr:hypothetical protein [Myxococcales bacterium]
MELVVNGASISGKYVTAVGDASGTYELVGRTETGAAGSQSIAFVVCWQNGSGTSSSCTAWSGQLQADASGKDSIATSWLLTGDTKSSDDWKSTFIGQDIFHRDPPAKTATLADLRRQPSHPLKKS